MNFYRIKTIKETTVFHLNISHYYTLSKGMIFINENSQTNNLRIIIS